MSKLPRPKSRPGFIFMDGRYTAKRDVNDNYVKGILVKDEKTNEVKGILNEANYYAELAYIDESTLKEIPEE